MSGRCPVCRQEWDDGQHFRCSDYGENKMRLVDGKLVDDSVIDAALTGPIEGVHNNVPVAKIEKDAKDTLLNSPGKTSEANQTLKDKVEDGVGTENVEKAVQTEVKLTAMYLHGTRVLISDEQKAKYDEMLAHLTHLLGDMGTSEIPLGDPYYVKKSELEAFVARLKR